MVQKKGLDRSPGSRLDAVPELKTPIRLRRSEKTTFSGRNSFSANGSSKDAINFSIFDVAAAFMAAAAIFFFKTNALKNLLNGPFRESALPLFRAVIHRFFRILLVLSSTGLRHFEL